MHRREFVGLFGGAVAGWPLAARAQQRKTAARIGLLATASLEKFELVVNLKAAKALGLELPLSIILRADEVIK